MQTPIHFGPFALNLETEELRQAGSLIRLRPQASKLLALLASRHGKLVSREEIRQEIWPDGTRVQFELGINRCIKEIRSALGDDPDKPRYIDTVHRRGYRFIAPVYETKPGLDTKPRQLTTHSHEASITAAAISPDGQYLAYSDDAAVYLKVIESGELHAIRALEGYRISYLSWFPDGSRLLASGIDPQNASDGIWAISMFDRLLWKVGRQCGEAIASPDGSCIAFTSEDGKEIWVAQASSEESPQRVYAGSEGDRLGDLAWISDGQMLLFRRLHIGEYRFEVRIECLRVASGRISTVLSDARLRGFCTMEGARLICAMAEAAPRQSDISLWEIQIDPQMGQAITELRRVTDWSGSDIRSLSTTRDGRRLAFLQGPYHADVYVAGLYDNGKSLVNARRLTLDDRNALPTAWKPDSESVLFHSDRNGKWEIFQQNLNSRAAELIISGTEDCRAA